MFLQITAEHLLLIGPLPPDSPHVFLVPPAAALLTSRQRCSVYGWKWVREWLWPPRPLAESHQQRWILKWGGGLSHILQGLDCFLLVVLWCIVKMSKYLDFLICWRLLVLCQDCLSVFGAGATCKFRAKKRYRFSTCKCSKLHSTEWMTEHANSTLKVSFHSNFYWQTPPITSSPILLSNQVPIRSVTFPFLPALRQKYMSQKP